jgi:hypothetical protein
VWSGWRRCSNSRAAPGVPGGGDQGDSCPWPESWTSRAKVDGLVGSGGLVDVELMRPEHRRACRSGGVSRFADATRSNRVYGKSWPSLT